MGFFFKNSPGELSSNVTNDAEVISLFYTTAVSQILRSSMQVVLIVAIMFALQLAARPRRDPDDPPAGRCGLCDRAGLRSGVRPSTGDAG